MHGVQPTKEPINSHWFNYLCSDTVDRVSSGNNATLQLPKVSPDTSGSQRLSQVSLENARTEYAAGVVTDIRYFVQICAIICFAALSSPDWCGHTLAIYKECMY